ncbi:MAG: hypothetical protein JSW34_00770 [Candidatus Zixiibacteriota bacterium]|nr:MAG: hypothetical protein JSW34_00770 [candidate division Zixibacteria bacterium]
MSKFIITAFGLLVLLAGVASPQEVVITDFPLGVAGSIGQDVFKPHYAELEAIADTLKKYPLLRAVVTGGADGARYRENHDAKNPSLALGRAHALLDFLIKEFNVDSSQIVIRTEDVKEKGPQYRYAGVRIAGELSDIDSQLSDLRTRVGDLEGRPPVEKHFTEVTQAPPTFIENFGLQFGAGVSSTPFGGTPVAAAAVSLKRIIYLEGMVGHTFWNGTYRFQDTDLDTRRRLLGGHVIIYPREKLPVGIVGGWLRVEEVAQDYYEYTRLSEGLVLGLRATPIDYFSVTAAYNPSKQRAAGKLGSTTENDRFMIYILAHLSFGGAK